jgi:hypothetical protein
MEHYRQFEPHRLAALAAYADADLRPCELPPFTAARAAPGKRIDRVELQPPVGSLRFGHRQKGLALEEMSQ